jgi:hypothetical protein
VYGAFNAMKIATAKTSILTPNSTGSLTSAAPVNRAALSVTSC